MQKQTEINCPKCTLLNPIESTNCSVCGACLKDFATFVGQLGRLTDMIGQIAINNETKPTPSGVNTPHTGKRPCKYKDNCLKRPAVGGNCTFAHPSDPKKQEFTPLEKFMFNFKAHECQ